MAIKTELKEIESLFQTCRLCLSEESVKSVFNEEGLQQWISDYLSIMISSEDHLSQVVCSICRKQLKEFHQYRERCHEVQNTLKSEIHAEIFDLGKKDAVLGPSLERQGGQLFPVSSQNALADELEDIELIKVETLANTESTESLGTNEQITETFLKPEKDDNNTKNQRMLKCEICHKILQSLPRLESHIRVAHGPKKCVCIVCGLTFAYRHYDVHLHTRRHLEKMQEIKVHEESVINRKFQCKQCPASFSRKQQLYNHDSRRHKPRKFACPTCKKLYVTKHDLRRHITTLHTNEDNRPFECDICQKAFKFKYTAYEHKKRVHGPKLHHCSVCGSSFSTNFDLTRHMNTHNRNT